MKTSVNWLKNYIDIPWAPRELASRLTAAGLEVEGIETTSPVPQGVIVAEILSRKPHPDSDHLNICMVSTGSGEPLQIVCGAPNCDAGQKAPLATIGTAFPDFVIKKSKLRGVESNGMLCSARELGLSEDHNGIMILPPDAPVGKPLADLLDGDTVIDWEVTPNRPDWLSHIGIAREIAAVSGNALRLPNAPITTCGGNINDLVSVTVEDRELCPRYIARVFRNVKVGPSPDWMVRHLEAVGLRSVNNVVDITNYVMLEYGNPLHAFDLTTLAGPQIIVRHAADGEEITTLDGTHLKLKSSHLLIADRDKGVALAGIMGGENSMITDGTTTVLLEAATFDRSNIRVSSRELGIASDSSYRYERGVSPETTALASQRAASLLCALCGAEQVDGVIDVYGKPWQRHDITLRRQRCNALLGLSLTLDEIVNCLRSRGLEILSQDADSVTVRTPTWRFDLLAEHDLIEEVAQMRGLDSIPEADVASRLCGSMADDKFLPLESVRNELRSLGLDEIMNYSLYSLQQCLAGTSLTEEDLLKVSNPISMDLAYLRPTLLPGVLQVVSHNVSRNEHDLHLYETGRVFQNCKGHYVEKTEAMIALTGRRHPERFGAEREQVYDFYDMKGLLESWLDNRGLLVAPQWEPLTHPAFKEGAAAALKLRNQVVAIFGQAADVLLKGMRLRNPLFIASIDLQKLLSMKTAQPHYHSIPQFPATTRDITFVAPQGLTHQQILAAIAALKLPTIEKVELADIYEDEKTLGKGRSSLSYSITFRNPERTLNDDEVNALQTTIRDMLATKLHVELR